MSDDQHAVPDGTTKASPCSDHAEPGRVNSPDEGTQQSEESPSSSINGNTGVATTQTSGSDGSIKSLLNTADLVKILEMSLAEIRASQTLAFSLLGFDVAVGAIIQRIQNPSGLNVIVFDFATLLWASGILISVQGVFQLLKTRRQHRPLEEFIVGSDLPESDLGMDKLRGALKEAVESVQESHRSKLIILLGAFLALLAFGIEVWEKFRPSSIFTTLLVALFLSLISIFIWSRKAQSWISKVFRFLRKYIPKRKGVAS